jgi:hypothetical protein
MAGPYRVPLTRGPSAFCGPAVCSSAAEAVVGLGTDGENGVLYAPVGAGLADAGTKTPSRMSATAGAKTLMACHGLILSKPPQRWRHDTARRLAAATFQWLPLDHPSGQPLAPSPSPGRSGPLASRAGTHSAGTRDLVNAHCPHFDSLPRSLTPDRARRRGARRGRNPGSPVVELHHGSLMVQDRGIWVASRLPFIRRLQAERESEARPGRSRCASPGLSGSGRGWWANGTRPLPPSLVGAALDAPDSAAARSPS